MKRTPLFLVSLIALLFVTAPAVAQAVSVTYQTPKGSVQLMPLMPSGGGMAKAGKMFVPGLTPQLVRTYDGAESPVKIFEPKPTLVLQQMKQLAAYPGHTARDVKILRLKSRKGHRELQISTGSSMFTFKAGTDESQMIPIDVVETESGFTIVPKADLPVGEYMLVLGMDPTGYDFSIRLPVPPS